MTEQSKAPSFARRDRLLEIEAKVQKQWKETKAFEVDADVYKGADRKESKGDAKGAKQEKYFCTFPYPYMNGVLHLGHAFTLSKVEFAARYQRLKGKKVLFPFGFHCTGMPIAACADKLKREIKDFGCPPKFPPPVETKEDEEEEEEDGESEAPKPAPAKKAKEAPKINADGTKVLKKKAKVAKKAGKSSWQWDIMVDMGVDPSEIPKFQDAHYWLKYFPPIGKDHLEQFGLCTDFRRSFITTDVNPYYDSFVRWQFNTLKKRNKIAFGARNAVFSPIDDQPCADHDRAKGEGVPPQDYTLIKLALLDVPDKLKKMAGGKSIILPAATLRPETMYGQTNVFMLPDGVYGVYQINDKEVFVCSPRSALNMSYQNMSPVRGRPTKLGEITGMELMGCAVKAPLARYEKVYVLPLLTIKMNKGTAVVTSVPSDAPDDYAALMDLKTKAALRAKYNIKDNMVMPFDPIPIIDIPGLGTMSAPDLCKEHKVASQNDKDKLALIKTQVYNEGFYKGVMVVPEHKGVKVMDAKPLIKQLLISKNQGAAYAEPESEVISRSGNECVVALTDQWYLNYGEDEWKGQVMDHINKRLETYNPATQKRFVETVGWLHEWACSRSYGLGTKLPWDEKFVIESLSDSTIYMSYYTVAHLLQSDLEGQKAGSAGIKASQLNDEVWDYIFLNGKYPGKCGVPQKTLDKLKAEFEFWYPLDLRVSGKDLIGNHLTMSLYNHAAVWDNPKMWPQSFYTNGHLMINAEKMSKSTGNFLTLKQAIDTYSADATRIALADAGDSLEDANFSPEMADKIILRLTKEEAWMTATLADAKSLRTDAFNFFDRAFANDLNRCIAEADKSFKEMQYRNALRAVLFDLSNHRDDYRARVQTLHKDLVERFIEAFLVMLSPFSPHFAQHMWQTIGKPGDIGFRPWPAAEGEDFVLSRQVRYLQDAASNFRSLQSKAKELAAKKKGVAAKKPAAKAEGGKKESAKKGADKDKKTAESKAEDAADAMDGCVVFVANEFPEWQTDTLKALTRMYAEIKEGDIRSKELDKKKALPATLGAIPSVKDNNKIKNAMEFAAHVQNEVKRVGAEALELKIPFDEEKLIKEHMEYVLRDLGIKKVEVHHVKDGETVVPNAVPFGHNAKSTAAPGNPSPFFYSTASPPEATPNNVIGGGAGGAGGAGGKGGAPGGGKGGKGGKGGAGGSAGAGAGAAGEWRSSWSVASAPASLAYFSPSY